MKKGWKLLWVAPTLVVLYFVSQLGSATFALALGALLGLLVLITNVTKPKRGRPHQKKPPTRADAQLQTWDVSGF
jgi:hypothetical protein